VLETKLAETERKMAELSAFRQNLRYYRERASALSGSVLPTDRYCEDVSFCGCLEAVTGEEVEVTHQNPVPSLQGHLVSVAAVIS
jgi:hypothetical protein